MKVQNLAIIFLVIAIPLIMILSYYLNLQRDTLELQAQYDTKLAEATKEGIKAFEVNTVDWSDSVSTETARRNATATVNAFITSLSNNINVSGTAKEFMSNYIPAVALTMYDGYYIYAPTYTPINKENADGIQLFYNEATGEVTTNSENGKILYEAKDGQGTSYNYQYANEDGVTITETLSNLTTDVEKAKMDYLHTLNSKMFYSAHYTKNNLDVIVNYTLDNRMSIYGENISRTGYLVYFNSNSVIPRAYARTNDPKNEDDIIVNTPFNNTNYNGTNIESEVLEEQVLYKENDTYILDTFKYIYDIEHQKLYYDETKDDFFTINSSKMRNFINEETKNIKIGSEGCKYKSISILWGNSASTVEYKKIYQVLNGRDKGKWCMSLRNENKVPEGEMEIIDTELTDEKLQELGLGNLRFSTIYRDYSAISYYVEAYAFTNWVEQNLSGVQQVKYNEETKNNEIVPIEIGGTAVDIFRVSADNNPEDDNSPIVQHKKEVMQENVTTNLNLSISNYNRSGQYDFKLPVLSYSDWEQVFSNVSLITFFQGIPIGLKYYNNYAIATSTTNREYVDPGEIYFSGDDPNYHKVYCEKCGNVIYTGYRSVEYVMKEYIVYDNTEDNNILEQIYYYQHDDKSNTNSETACYYCVVNKENFKETTNSNIKYAQAKSYNEALARERYYQNERLEGKLGVNITYHYNTEGWEDITSQTGLPEPQEVEIGVQTPISTQQPSITSSDQFIKYVFVGWADDPTSTEIKYLPGDSDIFTEDVDLYAIWRVSLSNLRWNVDYLWTAPTDGFTECTSEGQWTSGPWSSGVRDGSISYITIDEVEEGSRVRMVGNSIDPGKGATWATFDSEFLNIASFTFDYEINKGDSFNAGGFMFNITETETTLEGYLLSINFAGNFYSNARANGAIYKFVYNKGNIIGQPDNNKRNMESIELVQPLTIGTYDSSRGSSGSGTITITVTDTGYEISCTEANSQNQGAQSYDYFVPVTNIQPNTFGFFSDHYNHSCSQIGYFKLDNIKVVAVRDR